MITPQFTVDQDDDFIYIKIKAPYIKAQNIEFVVDENVFIFSLHPYYLRLRFPANIVDDDENSSADYDLASSMVSVKLPKETKGQHFDDLDMVSKLLARKNENKSADVKKPLIVEMDKVQGADGGAGGDGNGDGDEGGDGDLEVKNENTKLSSLGEDFDWEIEQKIPTPLGESDNLNDTQLIAKYGFDNAYSAVMSISVMNGNDINELSDPDKLSPQERSEERVELENEKFDPDYYLSDLYDNPMIQEVIDWNEQDKSYELSSHEIERITRLSVKEYILDSPKQTYIGLISLVFASCYDNRVNMGESTVESAWTIGKLSPLISCLDSNFSSVQQLMITCSRRALSYPLYRSWDLIIKVWDDVYRILKIGKKAILKILIKLVLMFDIDIYNVYNQILLEDYTIWIQYSQDNVIRSLAYELHKIQLTKDLVNLDLIEFEEAAKEAIAEQAAEQDMEEVD